jgi:hypothetical protein
MDWLRENWFWLLVTALFLLAHMGHGGHGGHGRREREDRRRGGERLPSDVDTPLDADTRRAPHGLRH